MAFLFNSKKGLSTSSGQKHISNSAFQPWIEKYRPDTIDDIAAQEHTIAVLRKALQSTNLSHMLFYGPPGTGKTSTILALARQLFGPDNFRNRVLELNASDERGIAAVRDKIKNFARQTPRTRAVETDGKLYPCPPYKIVILDEADSMTQEAQGALRRIMETYARITRFCLVCNYVTRIIEPLASRCSKFRFTSLDFSSASNRLSDIAKAENIDIDPSVIDALVNASSGDLRRAITYFQSASRLFSSSGSSTSLKTSDIQEIAGVIPDAVVNTFASVLGIEIKERMDNDLWRMKGQQAFERIKLEVKDLIRDGFPASEILSQLHDVVILHPTLRGRQKAACALVFAEADKALNDGADEELWMVGVALRVHKIVST